MHAPILAKHNYFGQHIDELSIEELYCSSISFKFFDIKIPFAYGMFVSIQDTKIFLSTPLVCNQKICDLKLSWGMLLWVLVKPI